MKVNVTASDLAASDALMQKAVAKLFSDYGWDCDEWSHGELQYCFTNDLEFSGCPIWSPVRTQSQMEELVPESWPGAVGTVREWVETPVEVEVLDEFGEPTGEMEEVMVGDWEYIEDVHKSFFQYTCNVAVTGGYVFKYASGACGFDGEVSHATFPQMKVWVAAMGGFLTQAEVSALPRDEV